MMFGTIFVAGIYGVGKSTLCNTISKRTGYPFYSAGDLISEANGEKYGSNKVVKDKDANQEILSERVHDLVAKKGEIILAGHFCIVNKAGSVDRLSESVFNELYITKIVLLEAPCAVIVENLKRRDGKAYSKELIQELLETERDMAQQTSARLGCMLQIHQVQYDDSDCLDLIQFCQIS